MLETTSNSVYADCETAPAPSLSQAYLLFLGRGASSHALFDGVKKIHGHLKWRSHKVIGLFPTYIHSFKRIPEMAHPNLSRSLLRSVQGITVHFHPASEPTHLPVSHPFSSGKLPIDATS